MADASRSNGLSAGEHAQALKQYIQEGATRSEALGNRGPIKLNSEGKLHSDILASYWQHGFYVFEGAVGTEELADLRQDVERVLSGAPTAPGTDTDRNGKPALGQEFTKPAFRFAKPLSDPLGGTSKNKGRHPAKMLNPKPADDAPEWTIELLDGNLQLMEACLRLYGHPGLLAIAEAVNGADFVPYNEVTFIKEPGLGPSVAWHQDGTTHWDSADWDEGAHGFNFMTQLYPSTPANCVWMLPGSHKIGRVDIRRLVEKSRSERIDEAVPMVCQPGDVMILNRQAVHGSFANTSADRRVTLNAGFFPRRRVLNVTTSKLNGDVDTYDEARISKRSQLISVAIDARQERYPNETRYLYEPAIGKKVQSHLSADARRELLKNYNLQDMYI